MAKVIHSKIKNRLLVVDEYERKVIKTEKEVHLRKVQKAREILKEYPSLLLLLLNITMKSL